MSTNTHSLPEECRCLMLHAYGKDPVIESMPTPKPVHGAVVVKVESSPMYGPFVEALQNKGGSVSFQYPTPFVPGAACVGRVAAIGPDTASLEVGQLVLVEYFIRARDDPYGSQILRAAFAGMTSGAQKLATDVYRNGSLAEYQMVPLENCHPIDEKRFLGSPADGGLGYSIAQLGWLVWCMIAYGGLRSINLQPGETIVILPATGMFGGAAVKVASAMGARVVACGRNVAQLRKLEDSVPNVKTVRLTGDIEVDSQAIKQVYGGPVDVYMDFSPPAMPNTNHIETGFASLANYGRVSLMGNMSVNVPINYGIAVIKSLTIKGNFMYTRDDCRSLIKIAATGALNPARIDVAGEFELDDWKEAFDAAQENNTWGKLVVVKP